jgi:hypothetical protein
MYHFCTYFDRHYLIRGLALYRSLKANAGPFTLWVLCFDDFTYATLAKMGLPELRPISLKEFEHADEALLTAKPTRTLIEYFFTCSPSWIRYLLNKLPDAADVITYLDADLFFYSSPAPIFEELGNESILIIGHRFPERLKHLEKFGTYNVGFLSFRKDQYARECLDWWRERCLEWCYDRLEDGRFADQKYLDEWPSRFQHVVVAKNKGANLAPWNWARYRIEVSNNAATIDGESLIFYHFHGLKLLNRWLYEPAVDANDYGLLPSPNRDWIYGGYLRALIDTVRWARQIVPEVGLDFSNVRSRKYGLRTTASKIIRGQLVFGLGNKQFDRTSSG